MEEIDLSFDGEQIPVIMISKNQLVFEESLKHTVEPSEETTFNSAALEAMQEYDNEYSLDNVLADIEENLKDNPCGN